MSQYDDDLLDDDLIDDEDAGVNDEATDNTESDSVETTEQNEDKPKQEAKKKSRFDKRIDDLTWRAKSAEEKYQAAVERAEAAEAARAELERTSTTERIEALTGARVEALKAGDHELVNKIDDRLLDLKIMSRSYSEPKPKQAALEQQSAEPQKTQAQLEYERANASWIGVDKERTEKANIIISRLVSEKGIDPNSPELWRKLDANLNRQKQPSQARGSESAGKSGNTLSEADREQMAMFGLNPDNTNHKASWLAAKKGA